MTVSLGKAEIEEILPHRDPFLLLDEVVELDPGSGSLRGSACVRTSGT